MSFAEGDTLSLVCLKTRMIADMTYAEGELYAVPWARGAKYALPHMDGASFVATTPEDQARLEEAVAQLHEEILAQRRAA